MIRTSIKKIDKPVCRLLRTSIEDHLKHITECTGLAIDVGSASYSDTGVKFKVTLSVEGYDPGRTEFERVAVAFGLTAADYGKRLQHGDREYLLVGLKVKSPKYPIIAERDGKRYKLPERFIKGLQAANERQATPTSA